MARVANSWIVNGGAPFPMRAGGLAASWRCFQRHPSRHPWNSCVPRRRINTHPTKGFPRSCPFFLSFLALSSSSIVPCPCARCRDVVCLTISSPWTPSPPPSYNPRLSRGFTRLTVYFHVYKQDLWRQFTLKLVELVELKLTSSHLELDCSKEREGKRGNNLCD